MRKLIYILFLFVCTNVAAQTNGAILWKVFASGTCTFGTSEIEPMPMNQNFIDVMQDGNKFVWGKDNVYKVYNKKENHDGFMSFTIYDFVDKYGQRGRLIYQNNRNADWVTKHMFYIQYEGQLLGMYYCSNEPVKQ